MYFPWREAFPQEVDVCSVQYPGRENRLGEPPFERVRPLVGAVAEALLPYLDMPFAFFGHSLGALISFEVASELRKQNAPGPVHLFVSGRRAPQIPGSDQPIHQLPENEFIDALRRYNGTPEEVFENAELLEIFLPVLRADFALNETYEYTLDDPLDCPISALGGLQDDLVNEEDLKAWEDQTTQAFTVHGFPGDHFFLRSSGEAVLNAVRQDLLPYLRQITESQN